MNGDSGLYLALGEGARTEKIKSAIEQRSEFTDVADPSIASPRQAELAVISFSGSEIEAVGIAKAGRRVGTGLRSVSFSNILSLKPISIDTLRDKLPKTLRKHFLFPRDALIRPTKRQWFAFMEVLERSIEPSESVELRRLSSIVDAARQGGTRTSNEIVAFERDAVAVAIEIFGGSDYRKQVLQAASPPEPGALAPFLSGLRNVPLREDAQIAHDKITFPGMEVAEHYKIDAVMLRSADARLTVMNCNRLPLEQTLGVDLIYYNHAFNSFCLVQYKRMTGKSRDEMFYRPDADANHATELTSMQRADFALMEAEGAATGDAASFRLSSRPFYFKLCEPRVPRLLDPGMSSGMYLPLAWWQCLLADASLAGPRGGKRLGWTNCPRWLNNTEFTTLLRAGWIGSSGDASTLLTSIIRRVVESGRMLVIAASGKSSRRVDYRRDPLGQFASEVEE